MRIRKKAFIFGITGQDGVLLSKLLLNKNYKVYGIHKSIKNIINLKKARIHSKVNLYKINLKNYTKIISLILKIAPDEVYNFSGVTDLNTAKLYKKKTFFENYTAVKFILEKINKKKIRFKFFQSLSSEMFLIKKNQISKINEKSKLFNNNNYAKSKILIFNFLKKLREQNFFICCGFFFNHESIFRDKRFIISKINSHIQSYKDKKPFEINNIYAGKDWGLAEDYVKIVWKMMQQKKPDDYIIGSGKIFYIKDIINFLLKKNKVKFSWIKKGKLLICKDDTNNKLIFYSNVKKHQKKISILRANTHKIKKQLMCNSKRSLYHYLNIL